MTTRRHVLALLASAPALSGCGGGPDAAAAWRNPGAGETDPRRFALAHAILAPNPHNTQPWAVELDDSMGMTLYCDLERRLPFTDPLDRQITLGCGAFLQLYATAARSLGFLANIQPFPDGAPTPRLDQRAMARVALTQIEDGRRPSALFGAITARRTNRNIYDVERIPREEDLARVANSLGAFLGTAQWTVETERVTALRDLVWRAFERELQTEGAQRETYRWLRFGREQAAEHRDGLVLDGAMIGLVKAIGMLDEDDFLNPNSMANQSAASDWRKKAESAPAFMWLTSGDDSALSRLDAGMAYARMNLVATTLGLAMHPWSQALQEYEEMADLYAEARQGLRAEEQTVQMLVRVGYAEPSAPSPRRDAASLIRPASP